METEQTDEYINVDDEISDEITQPEDLVEEELEGKDTDQKEPSQKVSDKVSFVDGLAAGLGIGSIACFATVWLSLFLSPLLPESATYEGLLAIFIYPLVVLLGTGLVALTAGVVREFYSKTKVNSGDFS